MKAYCDICKEELKDKDFSFEGAKQELITDLKTGQKSLSKDIIHICQKCYNKDIKELIHGKTK